jgi:hypothetical protein
MPMDQGEIESLIKQSIPDAQVSIQDLAGDGWRSRPQFPKTPEYAMI